MHRTESLDFGIVGRGSIVLEFESGETSILKEGDVIVQRGTIHSWKNVSDEWARIYFVVLGLYFLLHHRACVQGTEPTCRREASRSQWSGPWRRLGSGTQVSSTGQSA